MPIGWFVLGIAPIFPLALIGIMLRGMGGSINWTYSNVLIQTKVPDKFMGRVFALDFSFFTLCMAIAAWGTGYMVDAFELDPRTLAIIIAAAFALPTALWGFFISHEHFAPAEAPSLAPAGQD